MSEMIRNQIGTMIGAGIAGVVTWWTVKRIMDKRQKIRLESVKQIIEKKNKLVTNRIMPPIREWQSRPLQNVYAAVSGCHPLQSKAGRSYRE
jgi:hypothetical protein